MRGSLVEQNHADGVHVAGSEAIIETTVVRDTLLSPLEDESTSGIAVDFGCMANGCAQAPFGVLRVMQSLIERNHEYGMFIAGAEAIIEATVVRHTEPSSESARRAVGVNVQSCAPADGCATRVRGSAHLRASKLESNHQVGIYVSASDAVVEGTAVRSTLPAAMGVFPGLGVYVHIACRDGVCDPATPALVTLRQSEIAESAGIGIFVVSSEALIESTVVRSVVPYDATLGDGVVIFADMAGASATLSHTLFADTARAGVSSFGGLVSLASNAIQCAAFDIDGESYAGRPFAFDDRGGNHCGCPAADRTCVAVSSGLLPPGSLGH